MWKTFIDTVYNHSVMKSKLDQFREYFQTELSKRLTDFPDLGYEDDPPEKIKIALVTFAFDNSELINLLKARGAAIKYEKYDMMREINKKIDDLKTKNLEKYTRPVSAFLTFENEEGLNRCLNYSETVEDPQYEKYKEFLGEEIQVDEASEPTDIIWENRSFTQWERLKRSLIVIGIVFLLLCASFVVVFICSQEANKPLLKYPAQNCTEVFETEGKFMLERSFAEWDRNFDDSGDDEVDDAIYSGILKCFCD